MDGIQVWEIWGGHLFDIGSPARVKIPILSIVTLTPHNTLRGWGVELVDLPRAPRTLPAERKLQWLMTLPVIPTTRRGIGTDGMCTSTKLPFRSTDDHLLSCPIDSARSTCVLWLRATATRVPQGTQFWVHFRPIIECLG